MFKRKLAKIIVSLLRRIANVSRAGAKRLMRAMLRSLMAMGRRAKLPVAGFVLPTVTMVMLVVVLLTLAITLRSFDRAQNARNVRVNQQVLAAATPALDRAKAKIQYLLKEDPQRPTATPSDNEMYRIMSSYTTGSDGKDLYTFGDEKRLRVRYDLNPTAAGIQPFGAFTGTVPPAGTFPAGDTKLEDNEAINTAWRYPVDTDNNGKFDTYTLYGIFFRSPERQPADGKFTRARKPLEARTPPMTGKLGDPLCAAATGTSASLVGNSGWYKSAGRLKKSFFVYTVNVPITDITGLDASKNETFKGTTSISALEYQQDQSRIPLSNNAVVYEDDLDISPGFPLRLNGRIFTNSNLLVTWVGNTSSLDLFQVSSKDSCFYEQENSKIIVSGNVVNGWSGSNSLANSVGVHLFKKGADPDTAPTITLANDSVDNDSLQVLYNNKAYSDRLALLVQAQMSPSTTAADPTSVINRSTSQTRTQALQGYFKERLRKVPFAEVALGGDAIGSFTTTNVLQGSGDTLGPADATGWNLLKTSDKALLGDLAGPTGITLVDLKATNPNTEEPPTQEAFLGDRVQVGNNLPAQRWDTSSNKFIGAAPSQKIAGSSPWDAGDTGETPPRTRTPRVTQLADVGATERNGFWEEAAAKAPTTAVDGIGGLRAITGAGVYERVNSFLPPPTWVDATGATKTAPADASVDYIADNTYDDPATPAPAIEKYPVVWPDTMPMSPLAELGSKVYDNKNPLADHWVNWPGAVQTSETSFWGTSIESGTSRYAKGDLRMRATVLYHYATNAYDPNAAAPNPGQTPIACISSYYDPSTSLTARNLSGLPEAGGVTQPTSIGSNNGVVYPAVVARPTTSTRNITTGLLESGSNPELERQANYVFPNGRFANEPLRNALKTDVDKRTLADNAAIDAANCSLGILNGTLTPAAAVIPHGAIKEVAFLNGREIKAIDRSDPGTTVDETFTLSSPLTGTTGAAKLTGNYDLALEERQPLEIRVTQLDLNVLRTTPITQSNANGPTTEWLLPDSGIIYATRDDALPDRSDRQEITPGVLDEATSKTISPTDSRLDPTRSPNGIMLINGKTLYRDTTPKTATVEDVVREKGLTLVSNLPVYIKGEFNQHTHQEFKETLDPTTWNNFYSRSTLDPSFACRQGDPRLPNCTGDDWRPATVLADAVTLVSPGFREGFRNEGDFDLRNNAGTAAIEPRRKQGFYNNNFVTNGLSSGAFDVTGVLGGTGTRLTDTSYLTKTGDGLNSSYFNNFVTPIQRRGDNPEYLMEVCTKLPVSACTDADWYVDPTATPPVKASDPTKVIGKPYSTATHKAGTTADLPDIKLQRFPRRIAFLRNTSTNRLVDNSGADLNDFYVVWALGIKDPLPAQGTIEAFSTYGQNSDGNYSNPLPRTNPKALWLATRNFGNPPINFGNNKPLFFANFLSSDPAEVNDCFPLIQAPSDTNGCVKPPKLHKDTGATPPLPTSSTNQPLVLPVLQIHATNNASGPDIFPLPGTPTIEIAENTRWQQQVSTTTNPLEFNLIIGAGDVPSRSIDGTNGDFNGGVQNLPRFLETWGNGSISTKILGAFIQLNRSAYATAPYGQFLASSLPRSAFFPSGTTYATASPTSYWYPSKYIANNNSGSAPYFSPPGRNWGFDVGLLSQPPDLFTQRFTTPPTQTKPAEFFREVGRNDEWVQTLLCAVSDDGNDTKMVTGNLRPQAFCDSKTGGPT